MTAVWRYLEGGAVRHRLEDDDASVAVCGHKPWAAWEWLGANPVDARRLAGLRDCVSCLRMAGCQHVTCLARRQREQEALPWSWRGAA